MHPVSKILGGVTALVLAGSFTALGQAVLFTNSFDNGLPPGSAVYGWARVDATGGVGNSGALKITPAENGIGGSFLLGAGVQAPAQNGWVARFKVRLGEGTVPPADGFSFCYANDLPAGAWSEEGAGSGLSVCFDTYDNGGGEAPAIDVVWKGKQIAHKRVPSGVLDTAGAYVDVLIRLRTDIALDDGYAGTLLAVPDPNKPPSPDPNQAVAKPPAVGTYGRLDVVIDNVIIYRDLAINEFDSTYVGQFGIGARTGGLNEVHWFDELQITQPNPDLLTILRHPGSVNALAGSSNTFSVVASVTIPDELGQQGNIPLFYQWMKDGQPISGATNATLSVGPLAAADEGSAYSVLVVGPMNGAELSRAGVIHIVQPPAGPDNPNIVFDFNSGRPEEGNVFGSAQVSPGGGVGGSGVLSLTEDVNGQVGSFIVKDLTEGGRVTSFVTKFKLMIAKPGGVPADGVAFCFGRNIPDVPFGEGGAGTGLVIGFDTYDNGDSEAPAINLYWNGSPLERVPVSMPDLVNNQFSEVIIRMQSNGHLDLLHNGHLIFFDYPTPFQGSTAPRFAFGARTGGANEKAYVDDWAIQYTFTPPPPLIFTRKDYDPDTQVLHLEWSGGGILQSADDPAGPWFEEFGAATPFEVTVTPDFENGLNLWKFYRLAR